MDAVCYNAVVVARDHQLSSGYAAADRGPGGGARRWSRGSGRAKHTEESPCQSPVSTLFSSSLHEILPSMLENDVHPTHIIVHVEKM